MSDVRDLETQRVLVLWIPDWPVRAHQLEATEHEQLPHADSRQPVALIEKHRVIACSPEARREGVRIGIRIREAQLRCPDLITYPHDSSVDARRFAPVCTAIEQSVPGVEPIRPGLIAVRARGPARYYGGEAAAATMLHRTVTELGFPEVRIGVADGRFAAEQAARAHSSNAEVVVPGPGVRIVRATATARFLSPLPISRAAESDLAATLQGLGISTLGAFAALPDDSVRERFGSAGTLAHRLAAGHRSDHSYEVRPRTPPRELTVQLDLEPPAAGADHLAFACSTLADRFAASLREEQLVCTEVSIELTDDAGIRHERSWAHPRHFTGPELVGRLRWQTAALPQHEGRGGITRVRITPLRTDRAASHEPGLWNTGPDERVHHHLSRAQGVLGHEAVGTAELTGGRLLAERWHHVPWSTRLPEKHGRTSLQGPWPGSMTGPLPAVVFPEPVPVTLLDANGTPVTIDSDDLLSAHPARLHVPPHSVGSEAVDAATNAWSRPWPLREGWWRGRPERFRLQLLLTDGDAWLLLHQGGVWAAEGRYL